MIGASLMLGGHALAQEQANSTTSSKDYEVTVNNSEAPQIDQAIQKLLPMSSMNLHQDQKHQDLSLLAVKLLLLEASSVVSSEVASLEVPAEVAQSASAVASVASSEVASPRYEVSSVASSEVVSEINRSATSRSSRS